jgi:hypothetical protein
MRLAGREFNSPARQALPTIVPEGVKAVSRTLEQMTFSHPL